MNVAEMMNMIDNKVAADAAREVAKQNAENQKREELKAKIKSLSGRITDLLNIKEFAESKGINLQGRIYSARMDPDKFYADGFYHTVGFIKHACEGGWVFGIGIRNGGACGPIDFVVTENGTAIGIYEKRIGVEPEYTRVEPRTCDMENFVNRFDDFESRFENYIKKVCGGK